MHMAQLIMTHVRDDTSKPWIIVNYDTTHSEMFTNQELNMLIRTKDVFQSFPGYVSSAESFPNANTYVITLTFDTLQNAESARQTLMNPPANSVFDLRRQFIMQKRIEVLGKTYDVEFTAIE